MKDLPIIEYLNNNIKRKQQVAELEPKMFFTSTLWPYFNRDFKYNYIFWFRVPLLVHTPLIVEQEKSFKLPSGNLHYLYSGSLFTGYMAEIPKSYIIECTPTFAIFHLKKPRIDNSFSIDNPPNVKHLLNMGEIQIFATESSIVMGCINKNIIDFER